MRILYEDKSGNYKDVPITDIQLTTLMANFASRHIIMKPFLCLMKWLIRSTISTITFTMKYRTKTTAFTYL